MDFYRLEYNDTQKVFHFEDFKSGREENTLGWYTIEDCVPEEVCLDFTFHLSCKYEILPALVVIQYEWILFLIENEN